MATFDTVAMPESRMRAWAMAALRDVVYAGAALAWSVAAFAVLVTGVTVTASLLVFVVGVLVWLGFAYAARWTTKVDRRLAGWQRDAPVAASYRRPDARGFAALLKTVTTDPQTWRDLGWLAVTSILGFALGVAVLTAAGIVLAFVSMPFWFWAISDPGALDGLTNLGAFTVDSLSEAFAVAAVGLALAPLALALARVGASAHAALAARMLGAR